MSRESFVALIKAAKVAIFAPTGGASGDLLVKNSGTDGDVAWSTPKVVNKITVGTTAPSSPATNDIWVDTN